MSWEIALIASSAASAGAQVVRGITEARAGQLRADIERGQALQNADLATLEALSDERERRQDFAIWDAEFLSSQYYDGPSFLAKRRDAEETMETDVAMLAQTGKIKSQRFLTTAESKSIERKQLGAGKWFSMVDAGTTLFKGVYEAEHYGPKKSGGLKRIFKDDE